MTLDVGSSAVQPTARDEATEPRSALSWVTLTEGRRTSEAVEPVSISRVFLRLIASAVVMLMVIAVAGAIANRRTVEHLAINDAAHTTDLLADTVVQPAVEDGLLTGDPAAMAKLEAAVRAHVLGQSIARVKLWTPNGRIVYSDEPRLIGSVLALGEDERSVFTAPATRADITDLSRPENQYERGKGKLLEVYRPVWTPSGQPLLFETYSRYKQVSARTGQRWRGFAGITLSSLLLFAVLMLPVVLTLLDRLRRAQVQREELLQQAVDASDAERRRVAGTLHDGVVQELAATALALSGKSQRVAAAGESERAADLTAAAAAVRGNVGGLRSLLVDIYPPTLRAAGLPAALADLASTVRGRGLTVHLDLAQDGLPGLSEAGEQLVFRVAQECLRNAAKHSQACDVELRLRRGDRSTVLTVADHGVGFDLAKARHPGEEGHFGLRLLTDLCAQASATLTLATAPGQGTAWRLEVPDA